MIKLKNLTTTYAMANWVKLGVENLEWKDYNRLVALMHLEKPITNRLKLTELVQEICSLVPDECTVLIDPPSWMHKAFIQELELKKCVYWFPFKYEGTDSDSLIYNTTYVEHTQLIRGN